jgi:hypothetical protein
VRYEAAAAPDEVVLARTDDWIVVAVACPAAR